MPSNSGNDDPQSELDLTARPLSSSSEDSLPPLIPPQTRIPAQFNQQVNINQIPPHVLDKLSSNQIAELTAAILAQAERTDERRFTFARESASSSAKNATVSTIVGGVVALAGLVAVAYLAATGNGIVAGTLGGFLATIIAVAVGRRITE